MMQGLMSLAKKLWNLLYAKCILVWNDSVFYGAHVLYFGLDLAQVPCLCTSW